MNIWFCFEVVGFYYYRIPGGGEIFRTRPEQPLGHTQVSRGKAAGALR
jgi:hypothetical protein